MTKLAELKEGIDRIIRLWTNEDTRVGGRNTLELRKRIQEFEASQGIVIKVKRELPDKLMVNFYLDPEFTMSSKAGQSVAKTAGMAYSQSQQDMLKAGFVAVEPLIEEG